MGEAKIYILHLFKASTKSSHKSCIMNPYPAYGWANNVPYQGQGVPPQYPAALNNAFLGYALPPFMMELQGKLNESSQERLIAVTKEVNKVRQRLKRSYFKEKLEEVKDYAWRRSTTATDPRAFHAPGEGADLLLDLRSRQPRETRTSFDGTDQKARLPPGISAPDLAFLRHDFRFTARSGQRLRHHDSAHFDASTVESRLLRFVPAASRRFSSRHAIRVPERAFATLSLPFSPIDGQEKTLRISPTDESRRHRRAAQNRGSRSDSFPFDHGDHSFVSA